MTLEPLNLGTGPWPTRRLKQPAVSPVESGLRGFNTSGVRIASE